MAPTQAIRALAVERWARPNQVRSGLLAERIGALDVSIGFHFSKLLDHCDPLLASLDRLMILSAAKNALLMHPDNDPKSRRGKMNSFIKPKLHEARTIPPERSKVRSSQWNRTPLCQIPKFSVALVQ